ncbi:hypothetical protein FHS85_004195 [Rhodoligotrophos appendicifer]|uniref:hypothetical protein n=1 Tax=Rhodoligotrophos appendicifer TaxID=987056 RepID=UPI0011855EB3|nr:hypothetical protein [Rhodoligotrophos appendicifer]
MRTTPMKRLGLVLGLVVGAAVMMLSDRIILDQPDGLVSKAQAIIGRPATPLSYAGVARRTTRRGVYGAPVVVAPAPVVVVPRAGCVQAVNSYGQVFWRCP